MPITRRDILQALTQYDLKKTNRRKLLADHAAIKALREFATHLPHNLISQPLTSEECFRLATILLNANLKANSAFYPCIFTPLIGEIAPYLAILKNHQAFSKGNVHRLFNAKKQFIGDSAELITQAAISSNLLQFFKLTNNLTHALEYLNFQVEDFLRLNQQAPLTVAEFLKIARSASAKSVYFFLDNYFKNTEISAAAMSDSTLLQRFLEDAYVRRYCFATSIQLDNYLQLATPQQTLATQSIIYDLIHEACTSQEKFNYFFAKQEHIDIFKERFPILKKLISSAAQQMAAIKAAQSHTAECIDNLLSDILQFNTQDILNDAERINFVLYLMIKSIAKPPSALVKLGQFSQNQRELPVNDLPQEITSRFDIPNLLHDLDTIKAVKNLPQLMPTVSNADVFAWIDSKLKFRPHRV